ncbi:MAG: adenosylcobinamide-phosphate synthase CbiB [Proteobacteria bacterium]|nr:adenosylcobinamide-phosphate synthase CbiB [Pseudomonadota bacterium]MBU1739527.1 adenosylcobinamide-phosphate synthase CbiB [Pseudomonadota bacterium]
MSLELQIVLALLLDSLLGDPRWLPHPVRMIGWLAMKSEGFFREIIPHEKTAGIATVLAVLSISGSAGWWLIHLAGRYHPRAVDMVSILILYTCFAARDLITHSNDVHDALQKGDLAEARLRVGMIVGRDTMTLDEGEVVRATVESVAENTVDGVTAPLFWAVVAGPVGALVYKAINTLDSTFGYKNERYLHFGWAAARLDDLANRLPARLTGIVMVVAARFCRLSAPNAWRIFRRDRNRHASPNSGQSEAPMAGALGIQLGGISSYFGKIVKKPTLGDALNRPEPFHIDQANALMILTTAFVAVILLGVRLIIL